MFHSPLHHEESFNDEECTFRIFEEGVYVFGNGTGEWANTNGSGHYRVQGQATNACGDEPVGTLTIRAKGSINVTTDASSAPPSTR